ncbi:MAG: DEAD/DEAH box helicase family protein [Leptospiraceae bacterium]|nr:DEAD/DEAH box helicase family protein [Leptospiraceae bacterium]
MSENNPILNSPYGPPKFHYRTLPDGTLDYQNIDKGRRIFDPDINAPIPVRTGIQGQMFISEQVANAENHIINILRREIAIWRAENYPNVTRVSRELLKYWFENEQREITKNLFFAQREAVETAVWLNEVAVKSNVGQSMLNRLHTACQVGEDDTFNLPRVAFKMATGTGKTVVMAMLILYHYFNRQEYRSDTRFADYFLLVAPGITIRDRLGVLYVDSQTINPQEIQDYYHQRGLIPFHLRESAEGLNARIVITNYHSFELRNLQGNKRSPFDGKVGVDGKMQEAKENPSLMLKRVLGNFKRGSRLLILNDEAHHCYLPKGKSSREDKSEDERAAVWINGIATISQHFKICIVYDMSATPYYLTGSGYEPGTLFPWVVSDFGLIEAIEAGLVKIPFLPESDNTHALEMPKLRNLYEHVKDKLPKKGKNTEVLSGDPEIPPLVKQAFDQFYSHYKTDYELYEQNELLFKTPPVFIVVCNNTNVSSELYRYIAGYEIYDEEGNFVTTKQGIASLFSNYDSYGKAYNKPRTLLIDSYALENSDQVDDQFKKVFAHEIEVFKKDYRIMNPGKSVENLTDADILREVVNTVGKPGKLGAGIRCVVSVSMLTEGWDANTVTHVMGLRAFGSQLLCEQVAGRALRRQSYHLVNYDKDDNILPEGTDKRKISTQKFPPEYAQIIGIPFKLFKGGGAVPPPPPLDYKHIKALKERADLEITFPNLTGYRIEIEEAEIKADFSKIPPYEIDGSRYPTKTIMASAFLPNEAELTLEQIAERREQELVYAITRQLINHYYRDDEGNRFFHKFKRLKDIVHYWLKHKTKCIGDAFPNMLFYEPAEKVCRHIQSGIEAEQQRHERIMPVFNHYNKFGSTIYVHGNTIKKVYPTKKSHINFVVADTNSWEQIAAKTLEEMDEVTTYVKNSFLGFEIPYVDAYGGDKMYVPDFIAKVKIPSGGIANLVIEITGFNKEKEHKVNYVINRWLPAVNNVREKYDYDEWHFIEIANDIRDIKNELRNKIKTIQPVKNKKELKA